jgi:hypothetical protein
MVNSVRRLIRAWAGSISDACRIRSRPRRSGAQPRAPLLPARGEHRPPGPGTHAQAEPVLPRATAIVRLKSTLAHFGLQMRCLAGRRARGTTLVGAPAARHLWARPRHDAGRRASGTTLTPHRPGSRISTGRPGGRSTRVCAAIPGGQTGAAARGRPRARGSDGPRAGWRERAANRRVTGTLPFTERAARGTLRLWRTVPGSGSGREHRDWADEITQRARLGDGDGVHNLWIDLWTAGGARGEIL